MFSDTYEREFASDSDEEQSILSILSHTGDQITLEQICGIDVRTTDFISHVSLLQFPKDYEGNKDSLTLKVNESINMTTQLNKWHNANNKFKSRSKIAKCWWISIRPDDEWRNSLPLPILNGQCNCSSNRRTFTRRDDGSFSVRSSKSFSTPPYSSLHLVVIRCPIAPCLPVVKIKPNDEYYLPIDSLDFRIIPRLYFTNEQYVASLPLHSSMSFFQRWKQCRWKTVARFPLLRLGQWRDERSSAAIEQWQTDALRAQWRDLCSLHLCLCSKIFKTNAESYSENIDEPLRISFNIVVRLALHVVRIFCPFPFNVSSMFVLCPLLSLSLIDFPCRMSNWNPVNCIIVSLWHKKSILRFQVSPWTARGHTAFTMNTLCNSTIWSPRRVESVSIRMVSTMFLSVSVENSLALSIPLVARSVLRSTRPSS